MFLVGGGAIGHGVYRIGEQGEEKERTPELLYERVGGMTSCVLIYSYSEAVLLLHRTYEHDLLH